MWRRYLFVHTSSLSIFSRPHSPLRPHLIRTVDVLITGTKSGRPTGHWWFVTSGSIWILVTRASCFRIRWYSSIRLTNTLLTWWACSSVSRASDHHAADAGSIPRCGKGFFSQSQLSVQTLLRCPYTPECNRVHEYLCARQRPRSPCQSSVDYRHTKPPSMHCRLGNATLSQLAFSEKSNPNFPWEKSHWDNTVVTFLK